MYKMNNKFLLVPFLLTETLKISIKLPVYSCFIFLLLLFPKLRCVLGFLFLGVLLDSDLDVPDSNPLFFITLVNIESESIA